MALQESDDSDRGKYPIPKERLRKLRKNQIALLEKDGWFLDDLANNRIEPTTDDQRHFVLVAQGNRTPRSEHEWAWVWIHPTFGKNRQKP